MTEKQSVVIPALCFPTFRMKKPSKKLIQWVPQVHSQVLTCGLRNLLLYQADLNANLEIGCRWLGQLIKNVVLMRAIFESPRDLCRLRPPYGICQGFMSSQKPHGSVLGKRRGTAPLSQGDDTWGQLVPSTRQCSFHSGVSPAYSWIFESGS
jgi:hypothetical protein